MDYKQPHIAEELKRRIAAGVYAERVPASRTLAAEFGVNIKTVDKAVSQLVEQGLLERKKRSGTRIVPARRDLFPERMIEVIFEGFTTIFTHPFWGGIWEAMMQRLTAAGYRTILNMIRIPDCCVWIIFPSVRRPGKSCLGSGKNICWTAWRRRGFRL